MASSQLSKVIHNLRRSMLLRDFAELTDRQLLVSFLKHRDETAFEAIVRRHGPMVMGVCHRVLGNHHDSEDVFQATFLVLARKAKSIASRELLGNWLYGVAYNSALKAKASKWKLRSRERQVTEMPEPPVKSPQLWHELQPILDDELSRLPDKYRVPVVLCDLEGRTRKQVARELGCPEGTVAGRLARARKLLAKRLARHGLGLSGGILASILAQNSASACVQSSLVVATVKTASLVVTGKVAAGVIPARVAVLTEKMLTAMLLANLKRMTVVLLLVALFGFGVGTFVAQAIADSQAELLQQNGETQTERQSKNVAKAKDEPLQREMAALQGRWKVVLYEKDGIKEERYSRVVIKANSFSIEGTTPSVFYEIGKTLRVTGGNHTWTSMFKIDPTRKPKWFDDYTDKPKVVVDAPDAPSPNSGPKGRPSVPSTFIKSPREKLGPFPGIYELVGDDLRICFVWLHVPSYVGAFGNRSETKRPSEFKTTPKSGLALLVLKRETNSP